MDFQEAAQSVLVFNQTAAKGKAGKAAFQEALDEILERTEVHQDAAEGARRLAVRMNVSRSHDSEHTGSHVKRCRTAVEVRGSAEGCAHVDFIMPMAGVFRSDLRTVDQFDGLETAGPPPVPGRFAGREVGKRRARFLLAFLWAAD
jgi:hypothetical protein